MSNCHDRVRVGLAIAVPIALLIWLVWLADSASVKEDCEGEQTSQMTPPPNRSPLFRAEQKDGTTFRSYRQFHGSIL